MSYSIEERDIVIKGWEKGIADDPYSGISDMRGMNIISVPGESSVGFKTEKITAPTVTDGTVASADAGTDTITFSGATGGLENGMAVYFTGASLPTGITANIVYWVNNVTATTCTLDTTYNSGTTVNITATGTGTMVIVPMGTPKYYAYDSRNDVYWFIDDNGRVWSNRIVTASGYFKHTGNLVDGTANGNGILYFESSDGTGYIFAWRNSRIDYTNATTVSWVYGWDPIDATTGNTDAYLNTLAADNRPHHAIVGQGNTAYYTDNQYVGSWFQADPLVPFVPTTLATYSFSKQAVGIEQSDQANCLCVLGNNVYIGGSRTAIYQWNRLSFGYQSRILLAESFVTWMEVVNTAIYIFVGNRGRIYVTNGSQAKLYKKVPDHLSGTVEPYFTWGGVASHKNQLYFGVYATNNASEAINTYGGLWAIDMDTNAIRIVNQLSYGDYTGYASMIIPKFKYSIASGNPTGTGLYIGWPDGVDSTSSNPYSGYTAYIDTDLIPISTYLLKRTFENIEFKLTIPLVTGEGVKISQRNKFNDSFTQIGETTTAGSFSDVYNVNFENSQWIQFRIELKSTASSTRTYTRLKELRIR